MKSKRTVKIVILVVVIALIAVFAIFAKNYYEARYVGKDYYTMIPTNLDTTPETIYSMSGEDVGLGKSYLLTGYSENGEKKTLDFNVMEEKEPLPKAGEYLKVSASKQIVLKWWLISENEVPENALDKIKASK
jgi:uncharacterized protein (TIGR01655 family)